MKKKLSVCMVFLLLCVLCACGTAKEPGGADYGALELGKLKKLRLGLAEDDPVADMIDRLAAEAEQRK